MSYFLERLGLAAFALLGRFLAWHLRSWREAWGSAWHGPYRELRLLGLGTGVLITWFLIPAVFDDLGFVRGTSYVFAVYLAHSNATFFGVARIQRNRLVPLGAIALIFILFGVIGSSAIRPLIGEAKDAALVQDFIGALVILGVYVVMTLWFRVWQSGNPYRFFSR